MASDDLQGFHVRSGEERGHGEEKEGQEPASLQTHQETLTQGLQTTHSTIPYSIRALRP